MLENAIAVRKRDDRVEAYDRDKLAKSLTAAALAVSSKDFRDESACNAMLSVLGVLPVSDEGTIDPVREAYTRETIGDELYEAIELVIELVESSLEEYDAPIHTGELSELVHRALVEEGHSDLLREYIMRATTREYAIANAGTLMKVVRELSVTSSQQSNAKRDNANVNGETAMGTMLQYGSAVSKTFSLQNLIPRHIADLNNTGAIHIHDLDFYHLTLTCIPSDQRIVVRRSGKVKVWRASKLSSYTSGEPIDFEVWSDGNFVKVNKVMSKPASVGSSVLTITTMGGGELRVTPEHFVTTYNSDGTKSDVIAMELKRGMKLVRDGCTKHTPIESISLNRWFSGKASIYLEKNKRIIRALRSNSIWARKTRGFLSKGRIQRILMGTARLKAAEYSNTAVKMPTADLQYTTRSGKRALPDTLVLTEELAKFMGYMLVSGSMCSSGLLYNAPNEQVLNDFKRCAETVLWAGCAETDGLTCKIFGEAQLLHALFEGPLGYLCAKKDESRYIPPSWLSKVSVQFLHAFASSAAASRLLPRRTAGMRDVVAILSALGIDAGMDGSVVLLGELDSYSEVKSITKTEYTGPLYDLETENHHFAVNGFSVHNCCQIDLDALFEDGFNTGHGHIRTPSHIESYAALTCIAIQSNQNDQHGGQSVPALDFYLERGVAKTLATELAELVRLDFEIADRSSEDEQVALEDGIKKDLFAYIKKNRVLHTEDGKKTAERVIHKRAPDYVCSFEKTWSVACRRTEKHTRQAMESLVHNLNSMHSRAGAQIPFSSLNFGTATSWEGRLVSHKYLDAAEAGLGLGETPIFPISIFKLKKGVNVYSTDPNYDLFKKSIHVTARRMYPNFSNLDAPYNLQYYKEGNFATEVAYMGCLAGFEHVTYRYKGEIYTDLFERVWDRLLADGVQVRKCGLAVYMEPDDLWVYDSRNYSTTRVKTFIRNTQVEKWLEVRLATGQVVYCTADHPWPTDKGRKRADELQTGDFLFKVLSGSDLNIPEYVGDAYEFGVSYAKGDLDTSVAARFLYASSDKREEFVSGMLAIGEHTGSALRCQIGFRFMERAHVAAAIFAASGYTVELQDGAFLNVELCRCVDMSEKSDCGEGSGFCPVMVTSVRECVIVDQFSYDFETESGWFDVSGLQSYNCRTRVIADINGVDEVTGRGNLSFTTINLPQIALSTKDIPAFYDLLGVRLELVMEQLLSRLDIVAQRKVANMPFLMGQHIWKNSKELEATDEVAPVLKHGTLSIGFVGLAETLSALVGAHHGESDEAQKLGLEIIGFMRDYCDKKTKELSINVTLLATPAESTCGRFLQVDRKEFGRIKGVTDKEYYTNSFHVPVWYKTNARHKVEVEAPYHALTNAGHITYVEMDGAASDNEQALEDLVMLMYENNCGYFGVSHGIDFDPVCGYTGYIGDGPCPRCGRNEFEDIPIMRM